MVASNPFAPEIVLPTIERLRRLWLGGEHAYGFKATYNPTFPSTDGSSHGWVAPWFCGLEQGPNIAMIENHRTGMVWNMLRTNPHIVAGLRAAGFTGGWLSPPA